MVRESALACLVYIERLDPEVVVSVRLGPDHLGGLASQLLAAVDTNDALIVYSVRNQYVDGHPLIVRPLEARS